MPRPNRAREVLGEDFVAQRVAMEREARGWSYEGLAKRMTDVGCPINQSGLYRIERGEPRRRIVVDELVAFARVFGLTPSELLVDPVLAANAEMTRLIEEYDAFSARWAAAELALIEENDRVTASIRGLAATSTTARDLAERLINDRHSSRGKSSDLADRDAEFLLGPKEGEPDGEHREEG